LSNSLNIPHKSVILVHTFVNVVRNVATRYAPSRLLSFGEVHIFKTFQLLKENRRISRVLLMEELALGEGAIKTLVKHMKMDNLITTSNGGTRLTPRGKAICKGLTTAIPTETPIPKCSIAPGKFNHALLLKDLSYVIKSGIEQRDAAIRMEATGATTLLYKDRKIVMPTDTNQDSLRKDPAVRKLLIEKLKPEHDDVIIIGSSDTSQKIAELAAKHAALSTLVSHEDH
jgi:hypothetical protein